MPSQHICQVCGGYLTRESHVMRLRNTCATHVTNIIVQELPHFRAIPAWRWLANWRTRRQPRWGRPVENLYKLTT